jgi:acetylornithine deacetylase
LEPNLEQKITKLAFQLCNIPSLTYHEGEVLKFLLAWCDGLSTEKIPVGDDDTRFNLLIYAKKKPRYSVIFCTHIDTVPPFIDASLKDGMLWGRGSCDAKGIAAAMLMAFREEHKAGFDDIAVLLTVGEEESSDGAKACNEILAGRADFLVVGEPTELKAASAQKGSLVFDLVAVGQEAHSSLPHLGDSAVHHLIKCLDELLAITWPCDELFGETFLNIGEVSGGRARNMLAGQAIAKCIMRLSVASQQIVKLIESRLAPQVRMDIKSVSEPFSYVVPQGFKSFIAGFGSDAPYLRGVGRAMLIGPGSLDLAHQDNEHVLVKDLSAACLAYRNIAAQVRAGKF